ncbi:hypothetical protein C8263_03215 [Deinococcus arcticus]|uniref:Uncharacterized protein n=1 Tax=Deinococcus arcticus TaxID=2136176 RepID=A0A2T3WBS0_9DEIO|nr:hypothetical protein C8263_03215 [Deinococcus arcticus]
MTALLAGALTLLIFVWLIGLPLLAALTEPQERAFRKTRLYATLLVFHLISIGVLLVLSDRLSVPDMDSHVLPLAALASLTTFLIFPAIAGALTGTASFAPAMALVVGAGFPILLLISAPTIYEGISLLLGPPLQTQVVTQVGYEQEGGYHYALLASAEEEKVVSKAFYQELAALPKPAAVQLASFGGAAYSAQELAVPSQHRGLLRQQLLMVAYLLSLPLLSALFTRVPAGSATRTA